MGAWERVTLLLTIVGEKDFNVKMKDLHIEKLICHSIYERKYPWQ